MPQKLDLANVFSTLKSGNLEALHRLRQRVDSSGNNQVVLEWDMNYNPEYGQLMSVFNIKPVTQGSVIICTTTGLMEGDTVLASGLASQLSDITTAGDGSYSGWVWRDYTPTGSTTIEGQILGSIRHQDGSEQTFNFTKSIQVGS